MTPLGVSLRRDFESQSAHSLEWYSCPLSNVAHAAVGHAAPLLLLVAIGAALGHLLLRTRAS